MIKIGDYILTKRENGKVQISRYENTVLIDSGEFDDKELSDFIASYYGANLEKVIDKFYQEKF